MDHLSKQFLFKNSTLATIVVSKLSILMDFNVHEIPNPSFGQFPEVSVFIRWQHCPKLKWVLKEENGWYVIEYVTTSLAACHELK